MSVRKMVMSMEVENILRNKNANMFPDNALDLLPKFRKTDYFIEPGLHQLAARELSEPGYCSRVKDFVVGRRGYGTVMFLGETDVRWLDLDEIVAIGMCQIIVYNDEQAKPAIGQGLNKPAKVTLNNIKCINKQNGELVCTGSKLEAFEKRLKQKNKEQGAEFISYDAARQEWKFQVHHFSRFGLDDSDDEEPRPNVIISVHNGNDVMPEDINATDLEDIVDRGPVWQPDKSDIGSDEANGTPMQEVNVGAAQTVLAHSLPLHLRLDPLKMQQMKMLFFSSGEDSEEVVLPAVANRKLHKVLSPRTGGKSSTHVRKDAPPDRVESPVKSPFSKHPLKSSPQASWKASPPFSLIPYDRQIGLDIDVEGVPPKHTRMLLSLESKNEQSTFKRSRIGFKQEINTNSCMFGRTGDVVDAALFMGLSFRVGWGPHGLVVHSGNRVGTQSGSISSVVHVEKVALDVFVRDEEGKVRDELIELQYGSPLMTHMSMSKTVDGMDEHPSKLGLRFVVCDRLQLPSACNMFEELIVKQHAFEGLSAPQRLVLRHQVMIWHLLSVLFSEKHERQVENIPASDGAASVVDSESTALIRRAQCSSWLQDSVRHLVHEEIRNLDSSEQLKEMFTLLTGRQLAEAMQLAVMRGDVRLACLVSQAGGSMEVRRDIAHQLEIWEEEGLDFGLLERDMVQLYKLLGGDIQGALAGHEIDWKRYLGLLMWYCLPPDTHLPDLIEAYSLLLEKGIASEPIPMYVEEAALHNVPMVENRGLFDTAYYLMLLHANQCHDTTNVHRMFSSFSSTYDPLDHRMAWFQHGLLQAIGALKPMQLHVLDMSFASQLLSVGQCHWAIYVILHMPQCLEYPDLHEKVVKEILNQYCEVWSTSEVQRTFLEDQLGIPSEWLHESLGTYWHFLRKPIKAIKHFIKSLQWQRAHSLLMISVAASLFVMGQHGELMEIIKPLENNKMELDGWDVGGGVYADFFTLKNLFLIGEPTDVQESFEKKIAACKSFFEHLKESQGLWDSRWASDNRLAYSRMADEVATLLLAQAKVKMPDFKVADSSVYVVVMNAPGPDDARFCHLQDAASSFTSWLVETMPK